MDKENIIQGFIQNFISKNRKERTRIELSNPRKRGRFINRLNHDWENVFDMCKLNPLPKVPSDYEYLKNELMIDDQDMCYVISTMMILMISFSNSKRLLIKAIAGDRGP